MDAPQPYRLLFVCTANICRSPMAAALAMDYARRRGWSVEVRSGGVMGLEGREAAPNAVRALSEVGVDLKGHRSGGINAELISWADYILVMEIHHAIKLREVFPEAGDKILQLGSFGGLVEIKDPVGGWRWRFRRSRDEIRRCIEMFMDQLPPRVSQPQTRTQNSTP